MKRAVLLFVLAGRIMSAHPSSGLAVAENGDVYFVHSGMGLARVNGRGELNYVHRSTGGHWMCLDREGVFASVDPKIFKRVSATGVKPAILFADGGAPLAVGSDGNLYFGSNWEGGAEHPAGALTVSRMSPTGVFSHVSNRLKEQLLKNDEGMTGLAAGPNCLYVASPSSIYRVYFDGGLAAIASGVKLEDCDEDLPPNWKRPGFRGLCLGTNETVFAAATGCRRVLKISPGSEPKVVVKSEAPWNPTDVFERAGALYVLEWTNANGGVGDGWRPRVRRLKADGRVETVIEIKQNLPVPK
jgi:hypothetical protein